MATDHNVRQHISSEITVMEERLIARRQQALRDAQGEVARRGLANAGPGLTLLTPPYEEWVKARVLGYAKTYLRVLEELKVVVDQEWEREIVKDIEKVGMSDYNGAPSPPILQSPTRELAHRHLQQAMQRAARSTLLEAKNLVRMAKLKTMYKDKEKPAQPLGHTFHLSDNSRININSLDNSTNIMNATNAINETLQQLVQVLVENNEESLAQQTRDVPTSDKSTMLSTLSGVLAVCSKSADLVPKVAPYFHKLFEYIAKAHV